MTGIGPAAFRNLARAGVMALLAKLPDPTEMRMPRSLPPRHTAGVSVKTTRKFAMAAATAALALTVSACSTGDNGGGTPTTAPTETSALSAEAQAALDVAYEGIGSTLDDLEPAEPEAGLTFYVMSCGEVAATCAAPAAAMV